MVEEKIECSGGTVVKEGERKWRVFAPDGRPVGKFPTKKQALQKAEHWDKWDAFASLQDIFAVMAPFTFILTSKMVGTMTDREPFYPTQKQMAVAMTVDCLLALCREYSELLEKFKEKPEICNAIGAHHEETEMTTLIAPIVQVCDAISGARPGARREVVESYIKRLKELESLALQYPGVTKTYAIQAGRELRVIVGADKTTDKDAENLSFEIARKIQSDMTYPGQIKITVIRETRAVNYAK